LPEKRRKEKRLVTETVSEGEKKFRNGLLIDLGTRRRNTTIQTGDRGRNEGRKGRVD